tara:strand:+ start:5577 stop:6491 length:915 start_codon:yes stop_codon:yes gene_type:complete
MIQTDSRLITLNSNDGISLNGDYKSNILFDMGNITGEDEDIQYIECCLEDLQLPVSWYLINDTNNILHYIYNSTNFTITLTKGNYNGTTLINECKKLFLENNLTADIVLNQISGLLTFKFENVISNIIFNYNLSKNLMDLLGFTGSTNGVAFTCEKPMNLLGVMKINICSNSLSNTGSFSSNKLLNNNIINTINVNVPSYHQINYVNKVSHYQRLKSKILNSIDIQLLSDSNLFIEMNDINWSLTLHLKIYRKYSTDLKKLNLNFEKEKNEEKNEKEDKEDKDEEINDLDILTQPKNQPKKKSN